MAASLVRLACASATRTILSRNTSLLATNNVAVLQKYSLLSVQGEKLDRFWELKKITPLKLI